MSDPLKLGGNPLVADEEFLARVVRAATHLRRHPWLYLAVLVAVLVAAVVPPLTLGGTTTSLAAHGRGTSAGANPGLNGSGGGAGSAPGAATGGGTGVGAASGSGPAGAGSGGPGGVPAASGPGAGSAGPTGPLGRVVVGAGTTVGGFRCSPGLRQIPWSAYAPPCQAAFSGGNGGSTYRGVTATTILLADRDCPQSANSQAVQQFAQQVGAASTSVADQVQSVFLNYFQKVFDLYGRHVVIQKYPVSGSSEECTLEAEDQGQDNACADADGIANTVKAYGETGLGLYSEGAGGAGTGPFSECAAHQHLVEFTGAGHYPQTWYDQLNPYIWNPTIGCDRNASLVGENIVRSYANRDAVWAGDPLLQQAKRVFGTYVPNNAGYQACVKVADDYVRAHGDNPGYTFNYVLDVSRFADQASQAVVQFHAEGVTTIILACDPISPVFLTEEADAQHYFPEWYEIGSALDDFDTIPRLWDAKEITGHLFGLSQLGPSQAVVGPQSEPGITYFHITGKQIPAGTSGNYYGLLSMFSMLQAAGPDLTPANMARGIWKLPEGGAPVPGGTRYPYAVGAICYCTNWHNGGAGEDHTGVEDTREIYWDDTGTSPYDGKKGTYIQVYSGARFKIGEMPEGPPPFYPPQCRPSCTTAPPDQPPPPGPHDGG